jgi:hypothetical protein
MLPALNELMEPHGGTQAIVALMGRGRAIPSDKF